MIIPGQPTAPGAPVVLLVDDDPAQRDFGRTCLEEAGFEVLVARGALDALDCAHGKHPDVIMSDVIMRELDGFGLCRKIRDDASLADVRVLLLSAHHGTESDRDLARRVGAAALVMRTPTFTAELAALRNVLGRRSPPASPVESDKASYEEHLRSNANQISRLLDHARSAEAKYRTLFESAADPIAVLTPAGRFLQLNARWRDLLGHDPATMVGRHLHEFVAPGREGDMAAAYRRAIQKPHQGGTHDFPLRRADGTVVLVSFSLTQLELDGEDAVLAIGRDVTQQRRVDESLRQAAKMEAIGQFAAGMAHDFNNVLSTITASSYFLLESLGEHDPRRADAEEVRQAAERAASLTRQLLAFSHRQVLSPTTTQLRTVLAGMQRMLRRLLPEDIAIRVDLASDLGLVRVDVGQIEQVIMNLSLNARDAMPRGGELTIRAANVDLADRHAPGQPALALGRYVKLSIGDEGCGMSDAVKQHLFEPFFTTKAPGKGTGLGLSTCYGIVKQSGGHVWVHSEEGKGTVFDIYLPRVEADVEPAAEGKPAPAGAGSETILVVEDDERLRMVVKRILESRGYALILASNGEHAIELAAAYTGKVDLILSDVVMPGASGPEAMEQIRQRFPSAKALFMSGYNDHPALRGGVLQPGIHFIAKPFTPDGLAKKAREVLDS